MAAEESKMQWSVQLFSLVFSIEISSRAINIRLTTTTQ